MTIGKRIDGRHMYVSVEGRIDTITAPRLEREILTDCDCINELIVDFSELDYISSAGLRSLLTIQKTIGRDKEMKVTGCSDEMLELFEITGFYSVFNIIK